MTGVLACLRGRDVRAAAAAKDGGAAIGDDPGHAMGTPPRPGSAHAVEAEGTFVNPVCGVAVSTTAPVHVETYEGQAYYFCCDGCWVTFRQNPAKYAAIRRASMERMPS